MNEPHIRLTAEELRDDFRLGLMPAHTYLLYLLRAIQDSDQRFVIYSVEEFCQEWAIPLESFSPAKKFLIEKGKLKEGSL